ncbi:Putative sugar kinase [Kitasatospora sp. MMS16-BH015]|uniref:ROK family protein n=1 Tax=Kitasatospora sp. MMS16-BH015 TaxID=2018025 RepID=UPI000CA22138|nr:ROK family protein [Kitasatospora sp. MMS16-BH015]AUG80521.1 Putative sugar kinase [Kitasatospora sp. MMS16-BH015]
MSVPERARAGAGARLGVDVGGTSVRAALVDPTGVLVSPLVDAPRSPDLISQLSSIYHDLTDSQSVVVAGAGLAVPGSVDPATGRIGSVPTAPALQGLDPADIRLGPGLPIRVCNDANAATIGEWTHGAAVGARHVVGLFAGTGVGCGVVIDGVLLTGSRGLAAEAGHLVVDPDGPPCPCGGQGCLEQFASGTAVARWYGEATGRSVPGAAEVARAARGGDPTARQAFERAARLLGVAAAGLANLFNPEVIVLGGGMAAAWDLLEADLTRAVARHTMPLTARGLRLAPGRLGRAAGVVGAAASAPAD